MLANYSFTADQLHKTSYTLQMSGLEQVDRKPLHPPPAIESCSRDSSEYPFVAAADFSRW